MNSQKKFYTQKLSNSKKAFNQTKFRLKRFGWYRLVVFIGIFIPPIIVKQNSLVAWSLSGGLMVLFFILIKEHLKLEKRKKKLEVLITIAQNELLALEHSFSHFDGGEEFVDPGHFFSYDLDLFGQGSLFQFLNRTATQNGKTKLAQWLKKPLLGSTDIIKKQMAVKELANLPEWRIDFLAKGMIFNETIQHSNEISSLSEKDLGLVSSKKIKLLIILVPGLTVLSLLPFVLGGTAMYFSFMVLVQWVIVGLYWKKVAQFYKYFGKKSQILSKYVELLNHIESKHFTSEYLLNLQKNVNQPVSATRIVKQLQHLVKEFEYRQNLLVGFFLNSLFLWDLRCIYKLYCWHNKNRNKLTTWLKVIAETDALISLANYAANQSGFEFPMVNDQGFCFQATEMGHPLLQANKRINNDFEITDFSQVMIITGANMAGKSTFLRTVGVNLVLALAGAPVCAQKLILTPINLYTNMRTTDSLLKDESYFFAELKRLKAVLDRLQNGERIFVILDEMLKGTNSVDKLNGSKKIVARLIQLQAVALIATHDLKLGELEKKYPQNVANKCFEIKLENNEMVFNYKLSDGITKTMNATFLMEKMGII